MNISKKYRDGINIYSVIGCLILIIFVTIFFAGASIISNYIYELIILLTLLIILSTLTLKRNEIRIFSSITIHFALILIFMISNFFYTISFFDTFRYTTIFLCFWIIMLVNIKIGIYDNIIKIIPKISIIIAISIFLSVVIPNFIPNYFSSFMKNDQLRFIIIELREGIYSGLSFEKANAAIALMLGIGVYVSKFLSEKKINTKDIIFLIILFLALMLTGKRTLSLIPVLSAIIMFFLSNDKKKYKKFLWVFILVPIILGLLLKYVPQANILIQRFIEGSQDNTLNGRTYLWNFAIDMYNKSPYIGLGFGSYIPYITVAGSTMLYAAHNIYYQMLGEIGVIGLVLFISFFANCLIQTIILIRKKKDFEKIINLKLLNFSLFLQLWFIIYGFSGNDLYMYEQFCMYIFAVSIMLTIKSKYKNTCRKGLNYE